MKSPISPKVIVAAIVGIVLTALVSNVSAITPDMFDFLGPWKLFVFGSLITALMGLAAWWKSDPLRLTPTPESAVTDTAAVEDAKQVSLAATAVDSPAASFAPTQARIDAASVTLPDVFTSESAVTPPATPAQ